MSIVFDARKHAEQAKRAREAVAGPLRLPDSEIQSLGSPDPRVDRLPASNSEPLSSTALLSTQTPRTSFRHRSGAARIARSHAAWTPDITEGVVAQESAIVRSLLRTSRSERFPGEPGASGQSGEVEPATLISRKNPVYPQVATQDLTSGSLEVRFRISPKGKVYGAKLVKGPLILARAVIEAVEQWCYEPARLNEAPVDSQASTTFDFTLN